MPSPVTQRTIVLPDLYVTEEDWRLAYAESGIDGERNIFTDGLCENHSLSHPNPQAQERISK